jgi:uncharacterized protein (TIGR03086 family)
MDDLTLLTGAEHELNRVIAELDGGEMDVVTNCPPWTVRRLASHALKNQLFWAGLVTGQELMPQREAMAAVPYHGELSPIAAEVTDQVVRLWHAEGVLTAHHETPFGELPGAVVLNFAVVDAAAHAWDLSASLGRAIEFPAEWIPRMTSVAELTCTDHAVELGLVEPPTEPPTDATETQRLMAAAGRTIPG